MLLPSTLTTKYSVTWTAEKEKKENDILSAALSLLSTGTRVGHTRENAFLHSFSFVCVSQRQKYFAVLHVSHETRSWERTVLVICPFSFLCLMLGRLWNEVSEIEEWLSIS